MDYSVNVQYDAQMSLKGLNDSDIIFWCSIALYEMIVKVWMVGFALMK